MNDEIFCPGCGRRAFKSEDLHRFNCQACGFEAFQNVAAAAAGIIEVDEKILLTIRGRNPGQGLLDLPGGFMDPGESLEDGLGRELLEELNLEMAEMRYLASFPNRYPYKGIIYSTLDAIFICRPVSFDKLKPADDVAGYELIAPAEINFEQVAFSSIRQALKLYAGE